jgi:excisionase family DNA binding protein
MTLPVQPLHEPNDDQSAAKNDQAPPRNKRRASGQPKRSLPERNGAFRTIPEVADELAITDRMARRLCLSGALKATHIGRHLRVHNDDLAEYVARQRGQGGREMGYHRGGRVGSGAPHSQPTGHIARARLDRLVADGVDTWVG